VLCSALARGAGICCYRNSERTDDLIRNWLRNRNTSELLGIWEKLNNDNLFYKPVEFDGFIKQAGLNSFTLTAKQWIRQTSAVRQMRTFNRMLNFYSVMPK